MKLTNCSSWNDAKVQYPDFATPEHLNKFMHCDLRKGILQIFLDFCLKAKNHEPFDQSASNKFQYGSSTAYIIDATPLDISGSMIMILTFVELTLF